MEEHINLINQAVIINSDYIYPEFRNLIGIITKCDKSMIYVTFANNIKRCYYTNGGMWLDADKIGNTRRFNEKDFTIVYNDIDIKEIDKFVNSLNELI